MAVEIFHEPDKIIHPNRVEVVCVSKQTKELTRRGHLEVNTTTGQIEFNEDTGPEVVKALEEEKVAQKEVL